MEKQTLEKLEAAFEAVEKDLSGRVAELAVKSTAGTLSQDEQAEYAQNALWADFGNVSLSSGASSLHG